MGKLGLGACIAVWAVLLVGGMVMAMRYDSTPGKASTKTPKVALATDKEWTLVMVVHPQCPCSVASLRALREVMARFGDKVACTVVFAGERPKEESANMSLASQVKGAKVEWVTGAEAAKRYGAHTSGQTYIFDQGGRVAFSGGLTPGRAIDDPRFAVDIVRAVLDKKPVMAEFNVYGCALEDKKP